MQSLQFKDDLQFKLDRTHSDILSATGSSSSASTPVGKPKPRRHRKSGKQVDFLISQFTENPNWDKDQVHYISSKTGLSELQVYKWGWDYRKKISEDSGFLSCREALYPSFWDCSVFKLQKEYRSTLANMLSNN